jgi:hypothetical protein
VTVKVLLPAVPLPRVDAHGLARVGPLRCTEADEGAW